MALVPAAAAAAAAVARGEDRGKGEAVTYSELPSCFSTLGNKKINVFLKA